MQAIVLSALRKILYSLLFLAGLVLFAVLVLIGTQSGTSLLVRTALKQVQGNSSLRIEIADIDGTLFSDMAFSQVNVRDTATGFRLNVEAIDLSLQTLALFDSRLQVNRLGFRDLAITLPTAAAGTESDPAAVLDLLFNLPVTIAVDAINIDAFTLAGAGAQPQALQSITGNLQLDNNRAHVAAHVSRDEATWITPEFTLSAGSLAVTGTMPWQAMAGQRLFAGSLDVTGDIDTLEIRHELSAPLVVTTTGQVATGLRAISEPGFDLVHAAANVGGGNLGVPELEDVSGTVTTAGTPARITIGANADVRVTSLGTTNISIEAVFADAALLVDSLSLRNPRFDFAATGTADFAGGTTVDLDWELADFSDGDLWSQAELDNVNGNGAVTISTQGNTTMTALSLDALTGSLNGYPLTGSGEVAIAGSAVDTVALTLTSDVNSLVLEGSVTPQLDLRWQLQAPQLTQLLTGLGGEITGAGTLAGTLQAPQVAGSLDAAGLSYDRGTTAFALESLTAEASYRGNDNTLALTFTGLQGRLDDRELVQERGRVELSGNPGSHVFSLDTQGPELALVLAGEGEYDSQGWDGILETVAIRAPYGDWTLQDSLALALSASAADISDHCWQLQEITVCGEASWNESAGATGELAVDNIPLAWFNDNLPDNVPGTQQIREQLAQRPAGVADLMNSYAIAMPENGLVEGMLDLTMTFSGLGADWRQATLAAVLAPRDVSLGIISAPAVDEETDTLQVERYGIDEVDLALTRQAGQWQLQNSFGIYLAESGGLDFQGSFAGNFLLDDDETLGGDFELTFNNIAWVEALVPNLSQVSGELGASGNLSGTLERPLLDMDALLGNGSVNLPEFGLSLNEVELAFHSANNNEVTITGMANSGEGSITLESLLTMPLLDSRTLHVEVVGDNFEILNTSETRMTVAPDLVLDYRDQVLNVGGSLDVPLMNIDFSERQALAATGSVDVSRDVIIVRDDEEQRAAGSAELLGRIPVSGEVRLGMGDDVTFRGYGLDLTLTGDLRLEQSVDRPLLAHGELFIPTGSYELYGQRLEIEDGRLLFLGNPLNPALDIRAVRETRVAEVGLLMSGTVSNIQAQLFSTPSLPESEILSLLVTGNSFSDGNNIGGQDGENMLGAIALLSLEKGQGLTDTVSNKLGLDTVAISSGSDYRDSALGLGKYLSPNLFMRYDIGLFDRENVLTLDYILTERLRLEVETGVSQSVDLTYTVEK